jgi:nitrogen fixation protein NifU and related proteins
VSEKIASRCASLRHAGSLDAAHPEVGTGTAGAAATGDFVRIQLQLEHGRIREARFKAFGCSATIACASLACEQAEGKTPEEAESIRNRDLAAELDLPASRRRCSELVEEALHGAIRNCRQKCRIVLTSTSIV